MNEKSKLNEAFISFDINATGIILKKLMHFQGVWRWRDQNFKQTE